MWKELGSVGFYLSLISREFSSVCLGMPAKLGKLESAAPRMKHEFVSTLKSTRLVTWWISTLAKPVLPKVYVTVNRHGLHFCQGAGLYQFEG